MKRSDPPNKLFPVGRRVSWLTRSLIAMLCLLVFMCGSVQATEKDTDPVEEVGLGVASAILSLPYGPAKILYAVVGGVVGSFAWLFSGGDTEAARSVWDPSFYGTYVIIPQHLRGREPIKFFGNSAYDYEDEQFIE